MKSALGCVFSLEPRGDDTEIESLNELRDKPAGTIRITADEVAVNYLLWPALRKFLPAYPDVNVELFTDYGLADLAADRFDAGVRLGDIIAKDMIAVPIGPDFRMATVGSPSYFSHYPAPKTPHDLTNHRCINLRLPTHGGLYAWELEKSGREHRVRVTGQLTFNSVKPILDAALDGFGIAYLSEEQLRPYLKSGELVEVLGDWSSPFPGYHLYYPSRRQQTPAFSLLVEALRYRH